MIRIRFRRSNLGFLALTGIILLLISTLACHSGRKSQSAQSGAPWFYWAVEFKKGTSKDKMIKVMEEMQRSINKDFASETITYQVVQSKQPHVMLVVARLTSAYIPPGEQSTTGFNTPRGGSGGPRNPPIGRNYMSVSSSIERINVDPGEKYGSGMRE